MRTMDVVPYDPNWKAMFEAEKKILNSILSDEIIKIEHFGSTSVEGLSAKPIIDIMPLVKNIQRIDQYNEKMKAAGYDVRGENGIPGRRYFVKFKDDNSGNHTHHVHIYQIDNPIAKDFIMFRDYIRIDETSRTQYNNLKIELSKQFYTEPLMYTNAKHELVMKIMEKARNYFNNNINSK